MKEQAAWFAEGWTQRAAEQIRHELDEVGIALTGPPVEKKNWARSSVWAAPTDHGALWVKYAYRLPPGEERVVGPLSRRHPTMVPSVVATWPGAFAAKEVPGEELKAEDEAANWEAAARVLGELAAAESVHAGEWLRAGVRDRRASAWRPAIESLALSPALDEFSPEFRAKLDAKWEQWILRYEASFSGSPTLVHQDSGCCNIHVTDNGPVLFDWSDVVVGHSAFSCDRLLDQTPRAARDRVIDVFCEAALLERSEFDSMRRSNVLHEVLRYHDELRHIAPADDTYASLSASVRSQLTVLVEHEEAKARAGS